MNDDTSWDTDEVERWIANDEGLYDYCRVLAGRYEGAALAQMVASIDWETYNPEIVDDNVDWDHIAEQLMEYFGDR
jgi:hypothetical protein